MQYDLSLYGCGQIIELNDFYVVFAVPSTPVATVPVRPTCSFDCRYPGRGAVV